MYRKPLSINRIIDYQKTLDESDKRSYEEYGLNFHHFAFTELMNQRKQAKGFTAIFAGMFLALMLFFLAAILTLDVSSISIICISAIMLLCYGIVKISEKRWIALVLLVFIFTLSTFMHLVLNGWLLKELYTYYYMCGLIILISSIIFFKKIKN